MSTDLSPTSSRSSTRINHRAIRRSDRTIQDWGVDLIMARSRKIPPLREHVTETTEPLPAVIPQRDQCLTPAVLNVDETAEFLRISESIIRRLIREHRIPYFQIEGRYLFYRIALESWIMERMVKANGESANELSAQASIEIWNKTKRN